jgi:hypothetical protein
MTRKLKALMLIAALAITGCPEKDTDKGDDDDDDDDDDGKKPVATATATAAPEKSVAQLAPEVPGSAAGIVPRIKSEVDGKDPDPASGTTLAIEGAKGAFALASGWTTAKSGEWNTAKPADGKAGFSAGKYDGDPTTKREAAASALSYTECQWGATESVTIGKDKLPATVADGICKKDGANVKAAYAALSGDGLNVLAVGGWDEGGGGDAGVFSAFRGAQKAGTGKGDPGIAACCQAISQNMASAPPQHKFAYQAALGACQAAQSSPQGRQALGAVRAALSGAGVPPPCQ